MSKRWPISERASGPELATKAFDVLFLGFLLIANFREKLLWTIESVLCSSLISFSELGRAHVTARRSEIRVNVAGVQYLEDGLHVAFGELQIMVLGPFSKADDPIFF